MPQPLSERQSLKAELVEIRRQIAAYWNELENGSPRRTRREQLEWMIQERETAASRRAGEVEGDQARVVGRTRRGRLKRASHPLRAIARVRRLASG